MSLIAAVLVWFLAYGDVKVATRALLSFEGISVLLIVILVVVIFWKVIGGSAPNGQSFSLKPFVPASGTTIGAIAFASVFGLLSFGGFEGAAALGEETNNPRRNIPLAIAVAVAFCGVFYTIVMLAQSLGFGIGAAGVKAFSSSSAPLGDLAEAVRGQRHGGRDQLRRDAERVRELPRLRRGRVPHPVRARSGRVHHSQAGRRLEPHRRARECARDRDELRPRRHHPAEAERDVRRQRVLLSRHRRRARQC